MTQEPKTDKRIVSKGEYAKVQGQRAVQGVWGLCVIFLSVLCGLAAVLFCMGMIVLNLLVAIARHSWGELGTLPIGVALTLGFGASMRWFLPMGVTLIKESSKNNVVSLTRANAAELPAPESLVRASSEPPQEQEAVLLRAAAQGQETPPEQLVRPT